MFDTNNFFREGKFSYNFYDSFRPSIKLQIANIEDEIPWDNQISITNKAEVKAKIQGSTHLDQQYFKEN